MLISITTYLALPKIGPFGIHFLPRIELLMSFLRRLQAMAMHLLCCAPGEILTERCVLIFFYPLAESCNPSIGASPEKTTSDTSAFETLSTR